MMFEIKFQAQTQKKEKKDEDDEEEAEEAVPGVER